jgi:hypothetical protein
LFEALECGIERPVLDEQFAPRGLLDRARDALAVFGAEDQRPEDEQVERALQEVEWPRSRWVDI